MLGKLRAVVWYNYVLRRFNYTLILILINLNMKQTSRVRNTIVLTSDQFLGIIDMRKRKWVSKTQVIICVQTSSQVVAVYRSDLLE